MFHVELKFSPKHDFQIENLICVKYHALFSDYHPLMEGMSISNIITASYPSDESGCLDYNSFSPRHRPVWRTFQDNVAGQDLLPTLPETATGVTFQLPPHTPGR